MEWPSSWNKNLEENVIEIVYDITYCVSHYDTFLNLMSNISVDKMVSLLGPLVLFIIQGPIYVITWICTTIWPRLWAAWMEKCLVWTKPPKSPCPWVFHVTMCRKKSRGETQPKPDDKTTVKAASLRICSNNKFCSLLQTQLFSGHVAGKKIMIVKAASTLQCKSVCSLSKCDFEGMLIIFEIQGLTKGL